VVTNAATDTNVPAASLTYGLINPPLGVAIDTNGIITWTPTQAQDQTTNVIQTVVTNFNPLAVNSQHLTATNTFTVAVNGRAVVIVDSATLVAEGCYPTNNAIDPGETVTMLFSLKDVGLGNTTNLVATLVPNIGLLAPSVPQSYGVLLSGGGVASQPFTFTANGSCGSAITANFQLQDGALNMGTAAVSLVLGPQITVLTQNFDTVTAPALPPGWTTTNSGAQPVWFTTNILADTPPNAAFSADVANIGINELDSPPITLPNGSAQLSFRNNYSFETDTSRPTNGFDGGVLEIQIGTNTWTDITNAGGTFISNGYNRKIDSRFGNPLTNRWAWSGTNGAYVTTTVNLPAAASGQTIQLRWRAGTDTSNPGGGWRIDTVAITGYACCARVPPVLPVQADRTNAGLATLIVTNTASDPSVPPNSLAYTLLAAPSGAQIDTNGIITWTPVPAQVPSTNIFMTAVTDNGVPALRATNSFTVFVETVHNGPSLPAQINRTVNEYTTLTVTNTAIDFDVPALQLSYQLLNSPNGVLIDSNGVITWTPSSGQAPATNTITTVVTDSGQPPLSATNSFTVTVNEINTPPVLAIQTNRTIFGQATLIVTNTATDSDIPINTLSYSLLTAPANALIDTNGVITWTPLVAQVPSTNIFTTVVTDYNPWAVNEQHLSATNVFMVFVQPVHNGPVLLPQPDVTLAELTTLIVTNTATDSDIPPTTLAYVLVNPPAGADISTNGVITWTPTHAQAPSTNIVETVVTDNGVPPLSATNSFTVFVTALQIVPPPTIESIIVTNGFATISWTSVTGHIYRLLYTGDLKTNWVPIPPDILATNSSTTATDSTESVTMRFYRVQLLP
jgi:hypothetical protein